MALVPFPDPSASDPEPDDSGLDTIGESDSSGGRMSFLDHLDELRKRLIVAALSLVVGFLICFAFITYIFNFIMRGMQEPLPPGTELVYTEPTEAFFLYIKMAALAGLVLAIPVVLYQLWLFVAPGMYANEKRFAIPFVFFRNNLLRGGRAVLTLHVVPMGLAILRQLLDELGHTGVPSPYPAGLLALREALARLWSGVSDADNGVLPRKGWGSDTGLPGTEYQIRDSADLHFRGRPDADGRPRHADNDGGADDCPLRVQYWDRMGIS